MSCVLIVLVVAIVVFAIGWWAGTHLPLLWHYFRQ